MPDYSLMIEKGLFAAFAAMILCAAFLPKRKGAAFCDGLTGVSLALASLLFYERAYDRFVLCLMTLASFAVYLCARDWLKYKKFVEPEFFILYLASAAGMVSAVRADDFVVLFLSLELAQAGLIFLTGYKRYGMRSTRAAVQYNASAIVGTAVFLTGVAFLYAAAGQTEYRALAAVLAGQSLNGIAAAGVLFTMAGLMIKAGIAPFHWWFADVTEGAPTPVSAFICVVWRLCLLCVLAKICEFAFKEAAFDGRAFLSVCGVLTVAAGSVSACLQTNVKRLAAFTVMTGSGFALSAIASGAYPSLLFLMIVETVLYAGLFAVVHCLRTGDELSEEIASLKGKGRNSLLRGALYAMIFAGLTGLPPFAGFWGRYFLYRANVIDGRSASVVISLAFSTLLAYAYLKIVRLLYADVSGDDFDFTPPSLRPIIIIAAVWGVFLMVWVVRLSAFVQKTGF